MERVAGSRTVRRRGGVVTVVVALLLVLGASPATASSTLVPGVREITAEESVVRGSEGAASGSASGLFHAIPPTRVFDSRTDGGPVVAGQPRETRVQSVLGPDASSAWAVAVNITITGATEPSHVMLQPAATSAGRLSMINFGPGQTLANAATVALAPAGNEPRTSFWVVNNAGAVDVMVDVHGWYAGNHAIGTPGGMDSPSMRRLVDTRVGLGGDRFAAGEERDVVISRGTSYGSNVAYAGATALNITIVAPSGPGHVTVWPAGRPRPDASTLNFSAGETAAGAALVGFGADGAITIGLAPGVEGHLIVDQWSTFQSYGGTEGGFAALRPSRVVDTREGEGGIALGAGEVRRIPLAGEGGVPERGVSVVAMNVTAVRPTAATHLSVVPSGSSERNVSSVNVAAGEVRPNLVLATLGEDGAVDVYNNEGAVDLLVDVVGWFGGPVPPGDGGNPVVSIVAPETGSTPDLSTTGSFELVGTVVDQGSGPGPTVTVSVDGVVVGTAPVDPSTSPPSFRTTVGVGASGSHAFTATATDRAGALAATTVTLTTDLPPPGTPLRMPGVRAVPELSSDLAPPVSSSKVVFGPGDAHRLRVGDVLVDGPSPGRPDGLITMVWWVIRYSDRTEVLTVRAGLQHAVRAITIDATVAVHGPTASARTVDVSDRFGRLQGTMAVEGDVHGSFVVEPDPGWSVPVGPTEANWLPIYMDHAEVRGAVNHTTDLVQTGTSATPDPEADVRTQTGEVVVASDTIEVQGLPIAVVGKVRWAFTGSTEASTANAHFSSDTGSTVELAASANDPPVGTSTVAGTVPVDGMDADLDGRNVDLSLTASIVVAVAGTGVQLLTSHTVSQALQRLQDPDALPTISVDWSRSAQWSGSARIWSQMLDRTWSGVADSAAGAGTAISGS